VKAAAAGDLAAPIEDGAEDPAVNADHAPSRREVGHALRDAVTSSSSSREEVVDAAHSCCRGEDGRAGRGPGPRR
jgi:hypothetical protein